jgi:carboxypeptidase PM20D1
LRRALGAAALLLLLLAGSIIIRTLTLRTRQITVNAISERVSPQAVERLAQALRFPTVSHDEPADDDPVAFQALHAYLELAFPLVHERLKRERIDRSLLFTWPGSDTSAEPILLMGHLDVVPVETGTETQWEHAAFSGDVARGFVWGRGALDDKVTVLGVLEAVEVLLAEGVRPRRTLMLAFGQDEEVGGWHGAERIAEALQGRGVRFAFVLDEGLAIVDRLVPGMHDPVALVGIAEKGAVSVVLSVDLEGGHSSMPAAETSIGVLASAVARVEDHPMPARLDGVPAETFAWLAPEMSGAPRVAFANLWLARPLVLKTLLGGASTAAMIRTTTAPTIFKAGVKQNVLPAHAEAVVNFRIRPGDSIAVVLAHVRAVVADARVKVALAPEHAVEPTEPSATAGAGFAAIVRSIREVTPAVVAPGLVLGGTDSRHFTPLARGTYRFVPVHLAPEDLARLHGTNERVSVKGYEDAIRFYVRLIRNSAL